MAKEKIVLTVPKKRGHTPCHPGPHGEAPGSSGGRGAWTRAFIMVAIGEQVRQGAQAEDQWVWTVPAGSGAQACPILSGPGPRARGQVARGQSVRARGGGVGCGLWAGVVHRKGVLPGERLTAVVLASPAGTVPPGYQQGPDVKASEYRE